MAATKRYLRDSDYNKVIFSNHLSQLTQGDDSTLLEAELDAQACITAMLTNEYDIENEFEIGSDTSEYNSEKEYFKGSFVVVDDGINKANIYVNPSRVPNTEAHWGLVPSEDYDEGKDYVIGEYAVSGGNLYLCYSAGHSSELGLDDEYFEVVGTSEDAYSQDQGYYVGAYVSYENLWFICNISNGVGSDSTNEEIIQPVVIRWAVTVDGAGATPFNIRQPYKIGSKVSYDGKFYDSIVDTNTKGLNLYPDTTTIWESVVNEVWSNAKDYSLEPADKTLVNDNAIDYKLIDPSSAVIGTSPADSIIGGDGAWAVAPVSVYDRAARYERSNGFSGFVSLNSDFYYVSELNEQFINSVSEDSHFVFTPTKDPRNRNVIAAMLHLIVYQLCSVVVPDNIPTVRLSNYDNTMKKLDSFSKMKSDPNIPRKIFTITTVNSITGVSEEIEKSASKWAINESAATRDTWEY